MLSNFWSRTLYDGNRPLHMTGHHSGFEAELVHHKLKLFNCLLRRMHGNSGSRSHLAGILLKILGMKCVERPARRPAELLTVDMREETLFSTSVSLPANLTEGEYTLRIFLTREGAVVGDIDTSIIVEKVGIERWLYNLSRLNPLAYGLLAVAIALIAGWLASAAVRLVRNG